MRNNNFSLEFTCFDFLGNYSVTGFELILRRKMSHYIITYYFPAGKTIQSTELVQHSVYRGSTDRRWDVAIRNVRVAVVGCNSHLRVNLGEGHSSFPSLNTTCRRACQYWGRGERTAVCIFWKSVGKESKMVQLLRRLIYFLRIETISYKVQNIIS